MTKVQVFLGSESDEGIVRDSGMAGIMRDAGIEVRGDVYSAHRNLDELIEFIRSECGDVDVFIGVAGMAAALPGAVAAATHSLKVVLAVPLDEDGLDSCVQMPPGVPVLTAGAGKLADTAGVRVKAGLKKAAQATCQILAIGDAEVRERLATNTAANRKRPKNNIEL